MKEIPLTRGKVALVNDIDFHLLGHHKWHAVKGAGGHWYAARADRSGGGKKVCVLMHREITKALPGQFVDHINGCGLDNRRMNLKAGTPAENSANSKVCSRNKSGFKGVYWNEGKKKFHAQTKIGGARRHLGYFDTAEAASAAYIDATSHGKHFPQLAPTPNT